MSQFDFSYNTTKENKYSSTNNVGYFSLKNDGDEAIVRLPYKSVSELDGKYVHAITVDGKHRLVECTRNAYEPVDNCPLCSRGEKLVSKMFVKMLVYNKDETGKVVASPVVWTTATKFGKKIIGFINEYGDLSEYVFKLKRFGQAGSTDTSYELIPVNMAIYKPEIYVKDFSAFDNFKLSGRFYLSKSKEDLETFVTTGSFPEVVKTNNYNKPPVQQQTYQSPSTIQYQPTETTTTYQTTPTTVSRQTPSFGNQVQQYGDDNNDPTTQRPRRYTY